MLYLLWYNHLHFQNEDTRATRRCGDLRVVIDGNECLALGPVLLPVAQPQLWPLSTGYTAKPWTCQPRGLTRKCTSQHSGQAHGPSSCTWGRLGTASLWVTLSDPVVERSPLLQQLVQEGLSPWRSRIFNDMKNRFGRPEREDSQNRGHSLGR